MTEPPIDQIEPEEFTILTSRGEIPARRLMDGQEYIMMKYVPKYLGVSKYVSDGKVYEKEERGEIAFYRFPGQGHRTWLLRSDLDKIRAEVHSPQPFKVKGSRVQGEK